MVCGKYLHSELTDKNSLSNSAGQVAFERLYYAEISTTRNLLHWQYWIDISKFDAIKDKSSQKIKNQKIVSVATVKFTGTSEDNKFIFVRNHIYLVFNDESIDVNEFKNIPSTINNHSPVTKFYVYDLVLINNIASLRINIKTSDIQKSMNPSDIYGSSLDNKTVTKRTYFDSDKTSFIFKSGINIKTGDSTNFNNKYIAIENQYYD